MCKQYDVFIRIHATTNRFKDVESAVVKAILEHTSVVAAVESIDAVAIKAKDAIESYRCAGCYNAPQWHSGADALRSTFGRIGRRWWTWEYPAARCSDGWTI